MVTEVVNLMNDLNANTQVIRAIVADPTANKYQREIAERRIALNNDAIKAIADKIGKEPRNA